MSENAHKFPILLHMGMAAVGLAADPLKEGEILSDDFWIGERGETISASMEKTLRGLQRYISLPPRIRTHAPEIWSIGQTKLRAYKNPNAHARILIIPSLINGYEIVDLHHERSFAKFYHQQGFEVIMIDWGDLKQDNDLKNFDVILSNRMNSILKFLGKDTRPLIGVGYCMGGILLAASDILYPKAFKALSFIATPWDFSQNVTGNFAEHLLNWSVEGLPKIQTLDYVPADWLTMIFAGVEPAQIARKFSAFSDMNPNDLSTEIFVAVEDWVNGGADIPSSLLSTSVNEWYKNNNIYKGLWSVSCKRIDACTIKKPCHVTIPSRDKIVPPNSALALSEQLPQCELLNANGGHISLMMGTKAEENLWKNLLKFFHGALR